jgi:hypothetical protein
VRNSSAFKRIDADARFSSRCAIEEVPGIGSMAGERCSSQASAIWLGVAPWLWAIRASGEFGLASLPAANGYQGIKAMPAAISRALINHGLDGALDGIPALGGVIWKTVCDKLIARTLNQLTGTQEEQVSRLRVSSRTHGGSPSAHRFIWHYDRHRRRLSVWGRNFQRDLVTIRSMVEEGNIPRPDAIIYQSGRSATVLRGRKLDRWMSDTTRT